MHTLSGDEHVYDLADRAAYVEFHVRDGDPDLPARHWLSDIVSLEVSEHQQPIAPTPAAAYKEVEIDNSVYGWANGEKVRVGKPRTFTARVLDKPKPARKKAAKGA